MTTSLPSGLPALHRAQRLQDRAAGVGFDYFLEHNIALNVETRDTFLFDADVSLNGRPMKLDASFVSFSGGLRIFFR